MALKTNEERAIEVLELTDRLEELAKVRQERVDAYHVELKRLDDQISGTKGNLKAAKENLAKIVTAREPEKVLTVNGRALLVSKDIREECGEITTVRILPHVKVK